MMPHPLRVTRSRRTLGSHLALLLLMFFALVPGRGSAQSAQVTPSAGEASSPGARVIVRLVQPPLMHWVTASTVRAFSEVPTLAEPGLQRQQALLQEEQHHAIQTIGRAFPQASIEGTYQILFNGLAVRLPQATPATLEALRALPGVSAVYTETVYQPTLYASLPAIGAEAMWDQLGGSGQAGQGIKIALLDSGIAINHPMLSGQGFAYPQGYPKGDTRYTTAKVIAARAYFHPADPPLVGEETPIPGALGSGHGTHLAAIAAGNPITATYKGLGQPISGVAPRAWLMNYRIFYPTAADRPEVAYTAEILRALEDAVADGANILCLGWANATPRSPASAPEAEALEMAIKAGCVVVAAAGNKGPGYASASLIPGGLERVITVGSSSKAQYIAYDLADVTGPAPVLANLQGQPFARALFGPQITIPIGPYPYADVASVVPGGSTTACQPLPANSLAGKIAVIERGGCTFADKVYHAQLAGAVAVVIYDTDDTPEEMACAGSHCAPGEITIPAVMVSRTFGRNLLAWLAQYPDATLRLDPGGRLVASPTDVISSFSGRGPAFARTLKPDLIAPGEAVLAAFHDPGQGAAAYAQLSGTSVACAHVAGAAALLLQAHPNWNHDQIKAALMSTARWQDLRSAPASSAPAGVLQRGAGLVSLARVVSASLLCLPASIALPQAVPGGSYRVFLDLRDTRTTGASRPFTPSVQSDFGLQISAPTVNLPPWGIVQVAINVNVLPQAPLGDLVADLAWHSGEIEIHVPIWVHVQPPLKTARVLLLDNDFSAFEAYRDYAPYVTAALNDLGISYDVWDADARWGNRQTIPNLEVLQQYEAVIWLTGDNRNPDGYYLVSTPLTAVDLQILAAYLDGGGRLLAIGQNLAEASDVNPDPDPTWGRAILYHHYLGAHWLQGSLFDPAGAGNRPPPARPSVVGVPGSFLAAIMLDLGAVGDGAGNQVSVDEIGVGGLQDGGDADLVQPLLMAIAGTPVGAGYVGVAKGDEPTLERQTLRIPYRTVYLAFGLEGVNNNPGSTSRAQLLQRALAWLLDQVTITVQDSVATLHTLIRITCSARSSAGASIARYRWRIGTGESARLVESAEPWISLTFAAPGRYPLWVEATDALGHKAVAQGEVIVTEAGGSDLLARPANALPGQEIRYEVRARNSTGAPLQLSVRLPLPAGTEYISHTGGNWANNALTWSGTIPAGATHLSELRVRIRAETPLRSEIVATAEFTLGGLTFTRSARTYVGGRISLPLIHK